MSGEKEYLDFGRLTNATSEIRRLPARRDKSAPIYITAIVATNIALEWVVLGRRKQPLSLAKIAHLYIETFTIYPKQKSDISH